MIIMIFAIPLLPVVWLMTLPLARAYAEGFAFAREPTHRITSEGCWFFFAGFVKRRLRKWIPVWVTLFVVSLTFLPLIREFYFYDLWGGSLSLAMRLAASSVFTETLVDFALMNYVGLLIFAPRIPRSWQLTATALVFAIAISGAMAGTLCIIMRLADLDFTSFVGPQMLFFMHIYVALNARRSARQGGDGWFLLDG